MLVTSTDVHVYVHSSSEFARCIQVEVLVDQDVKRVQLERSARLSRDGVALMGMERFHISIEDGSSQTWLNKETVEDVTTALALHLGILIKHNPTALTELTVRITDRDAPDYEPVYLGAD